MLVKLKVANGKAAGTTYIVWKTPYIIGRHAQANLQIDNLKVSVHHCCLILRDNEVWVRDMKSTNGTLVNGEPIEEARLELGDRIQIGPAILEVLQESTGVLREDDRDEYTPTSPAMPAAPPTTKHPRQNRPRQ